MEVIIEVLMKFTFIEMPGPLRERGCASQYTTV